MNKLYDLRETARDIFGVRLSSSQEDIHNAYREKAKRFHPDKTGKERTMKLINQAYEILVRPDPNKNYCLIEEFQGLVLKSFEEKNKTSEDINEWYKRKFYGNGVI